MIHYAQMFNISKELTEDSYTHVNELRVVYDYETKKHNYFQGGGGWSLFRFFDREKPYSLYTNARFNDHPKTGDVNVFFSPVFYETSNGLEGCGDVYEIIAPFPMAINKNDELMIDFFSRPLHSRFHPQIDLIETICNNPLSRVYNRDEFYHEGFRTPHLYHQSIYIYKGLLYIGEFGEQKYNHGHVNVKIMDKGKVVYDRSIFDFNESSVSPICTQCQMELTNDEVFAYGRKMINHTLIDFNTTKPDANPPTITMLRVIDNEKISMLIENANTARLEITAGDGSCDSFRKTLVYDKQFHIEVLWSADGEAFYDLPVEEDPQKAHPGYGFFYNVSLASLSVLGGNDTWITIKIILTDEAGNSQVQTFTPLFYYGSSIGIDEISTGSISSKAYPNPFTGMVNIELKNPVSGEVYLEIYDISGRIIHQQKHHCDATTSFSWNGSHAKEGMYFYGIYSKEGVARGKMVVK
jgi:hypothetical protein